MRMKPVVSVATITYNHEPFIRGCIEGILMQKTTFPFELVIGEDCSTDGTREIVLDYAKKYPEIIRVVTSESNVGGRKNVNRTIFACQGEFLAVCEGDDYWIDPLKLQKQYDAIIKYAAVLITHSTMVVFYQDGKTTSELKIRRARDESGFLDFADIITSKALFHTSSFFLRSEILKNLPEWYYQAPVGDLPIKVISAYLGKIYYIDEIMSVYHKGVSGSYTEHKRVSLIQEDDWRADHEKDFMQMYINIDEYTKHQYADIIRDVIKGRLLYYYEISGNLDFLPALGLQGEDFKRIALLTRLLSPGRRRKVLGKIVTRKIEDYLKGAESTKKIDQESNSI